MRRSKTVYQIDNRFSVIDHAGALRFFPFTSPPQLLLLFFYPLSLALTMII